MIKFIFFFVFWLIVQIISINVLKKNKIKDLKLAQSITSLINCIILIIYFLFIKKIDRKLNIIIFITYYLTDLLYFFTFYATDVDLQAEENVNEVKKKSILRDRYFYLGHHIVSLILLYSVYLNIDNKEIYNYTNIFIFLLELPTIFLSLMYIFKYLNFTEADYFCRIMFNFLFIICRSILFNVFLFIFIKTNFMKKKKLKVKNLMLILINLGILSIGNIVQGILNAKYLYKLYQSSKKNDNNNT